MNKIIKAILYASWMHRKQKRKITNYPYVIHPLTVGYVLWKSKQSTDIICAGILHDTIEDTDTTYDDVVKLFNKDIANMVASVSNNIKDKYLHSNSKIIKLADVYSNYSDTLKYGQCVSDSKLEKYITFLRGNKSLLSFVDIKLSETNKGVINIKS